MHARQLRTVFLAVISLLLVGTLYVLYQQREMQTGPVVVATPTPAPTATPEATESPETRLSVNGETFTIKPGKGFHHSLDDESGRPRGDIFGEEWRHTDTKGELEIVRPVIRVRTPRGQFIHVTADRGRIQVKNVEGGTPEPRSGELIGNVRITVDRLNEEQREALTPEQQQQTEGERFIKLYMDDIALDFEFARVETDGPFRVEAAETTILGRGLHLRYNELESRVEELVVREGERIIVYGMNNRFAVGMGTAAEEASAEDSGATASAATPRPTPTPPPATAPLGDSDLPPLLAEDAPPAPRVRPTDEYVAEFEGDVRVAEFESEQRVGTLAADHLRVLFDFRQREREMARQAPPGMTVEEALAAEQATTQPVAPPPTIDRTHRIELAWSGPLKILSRRLTDRAPDAEQRVHIHASGDEVVVEDAKTHVECAELHYRNENEYVRLVGRTNEPAHVVLKGSGELFGREIQLNRSAQEARATGPGGRLITTEARSLVEAPPDADGTIDDNDAVPLDIRFEREVTARFGKAPLTRLNPRTGEQVTVEREILESAVFVGDVVMDRGAERIQCERIELDFALGPHGKQYPTTVRAYGDARMSQDAKYIRAADRILLTLELIEEDVDRPPFNLAVARQRAVEQGENPDALNWEAIRAAYEQEKSYTPGIKDLKAYGAVEVRDPAQRLDIDCGKLECAFARGREIQSGLVTPGDGGTAFVALGDFSIAAPTPIPFDAVRQTARVDGSGRMTFPSKQDIDGRILDEPLLVSVKWADRMAFDGPRNEAVFHGQVNIESKTSAFACESLRVDFAETAPSEGQLAAADADARADKWWLLTPLIERAGEDGDRRFAVTGPAFDKEPVYIYATGDVVATSHNEDETTHELRSRVRFAGPIMAIDLRQRYVHVEGAGTLLIEDYRRPSAEDGRTAAAGDADGNVTPFGRMVGGEPSQTYIAWQEAMRYRDELATAEFLKDVTLVHATGDKMKGVSTGSYDGGREAKLNCQTLIVQFVRDTDAPESGAGRLSGNDVQAFTASDQVYFADAGISAIAHQITYTREDGGILQIMGSADAPAELFDQRKRFDTLKGPHFMWNRETNRIHAPKSRAHIN